MLLKGKTAVVTGGGTGIGYAIAVAFAEQGCKTVIGGRRPETLAEAAKAFTGQPALLYHALDVGDRRSVSEFFQWSKKQLGQIDILVNGAGINVPQRMMHNLAPEDWDRMMTINATGAFNCMREVLPEMRRRKDGLIINISSISGIRAAPLGGVGYNASKFAMSALGIAVGVEEGPNGIRVTNIYPGEVETPILEFRPTPVTAEHRARILQPEDIAQTALMVACLPPRVHVPEMVVKPTSQPFI